MRILYPLIIFLLSGNIFFGQSYGCIDSTLIDPFAICPLIYAPVCGCDGVTYSNDCVAPNLGGVTSWTQGACGSTPCIDPSLINTMVICAAYYDPVCGCDGMTYSNICQATNYGGVTSYTFGACGSGNPCPNPFIIDEGYDCFDNYGLNPVCGCDSLTYANECIAEINNGNWDYSIGSCNTTDCFNQNQINPSINCGTDYAPVCGCDGNTYNNPCEAVTVGGVVTWVDGPCAAPCTDSDLIDNTVVCSLAFNPVCGCDGETYYNPCVASNYFGLTDWDAGLCDASVCFNPDQIISSINCNSAATQIICGCDSVTYNNTCEAFYLGGVQNWTLGSCTNGFSELSQYFEVEMFPNPANNFMVLSIAAIKNLDVEISIMDISGKTLQNVFVGNIMDFETEHTISTENLNTGIYLLVIQSDNKHLTKKLNILKD